MIIPKRKWRYPLSLEREYARFLVQLVQKKFEVIETFLPEMVDKVYKNRLDEDDDEEESLTEKMLKAAGVAFLFDKIRRRIKKISALPIINKIFGKVDKHTKTEQAETFKSVFGAEVQQKTPPKFEMLKTIWTAENMTLIKSIDNQTMEKIQYTLSQKIISAADKKILLQDLTQEIKNIAKVSEKRAALISADQVGKLNGRLVQYRQQSAGIEYFIWRTMGDRRVRPAHAAKNGVMYRWDSPVEKPGEAIRCRCIAQPVIDEQSFRLVPKDGSYTEQNQNAIIESRLEYSFERNLNSKNTPPKYIAKINGEDLKAVEQVINYAEKRIVTAEIENAVIITKNGEIYHCTGELNSLPTIEKLGNKLNGATVTHNHPKNSVSEWSFSDDDVTLFRNFNLAKLRGVDEKFIYEFTRNAEEIDDTVLFGDANEFNAWHGQIVEIAKFYKIGYRRWEK